MLIQQYSEELRRWECIGVGRILAKEGQSPLTETTVNATAKVAFSVNVGTSLNSQKEHIYRTVRCAVYRNSWLQDVFAVAQTLKKGETVLFAGWIKKYKITNEQGEVVESAECRIEFLLKMPKGGDCGTFAELGNANGVASAETDDLDDDYAF